MGMATATKRWTREEVLALQDAARPGVRYELIDGELLVSPSPTSPHQLVVNAFNPGRIYVGGEITAVWELLEGPIRDALAEGTITDRTRATPVQPDSAPAEYRLRGAVALVTAPGYAALAVG